MIGVHLEWQEQIAIISKFEILMAHVKIPD